MDEIENRAWGELAPTRDITDKEFHRIRDFIKINYGINLSDEKKSLIFSRLCPVLKAARIDDFTQYFDFLAADRTGEAVATFINKITTNHTYFMREPDHFDLLRDEILPFIEKRHGAEKDLRIWCAGCSSGEEAYTIQMVIKDYFRNKPGWNTEILATDISTAVLTKAVKGVYSAEALGPLPAKWKESYLVPRGKSHMEICGAVKRDVTFRKFNFMDKLPFIKPFQAIFCRNVMIYFDSETRARLVAKFYDCVEPGGYLLVGHSESLNGDASGFKHVAPAAYRKG
ncbi:MAG: protein-glutamate O-methyltransferase CheR [Clostridiales bacterium]|nr:protein-glutamate O-methyltransferase CheR [Clostridiales bacterium]